VKKEEAIYVGLIGIVERNINMRAFIYLQLQSADDDVISSSLLSLLVAC
jgi:hypothetical protein